VSDPSVRFGTVDGEPARPWPPASWRPPSCPASACSGPGLRHRGEELLALPGGVEGYRDRHVTGLPLLAPWANRLPGWRYRAAGVEVDLGGPGPDHRPGRAADPRHPDRAPGLAAGAAGRRGRPGGAGGRLRLRRLARAAGRVPVPPPAHRDRHPPGASLAVTTTLAATGQAAGAGRLRLASLPAAPRGAEGGLAAAAPPPHPPGAGRPRPAHRQVGRRARRGRPGRRAHLRRPVRPGRRPGRAPPRPGGCRPAAGCRLRRRLQPRPGVRPSGGPSSSAWSR
jgi:hypothetical protein